MTPPTASAETQALLAHTGWVTALARSLVRDPARADDLAQEAWLAALEHPPSADRSLRGWLATVLRNLVRQDARGGRRRRERERVAAREEATGSTLDLVERLALHRQLVEVLEGVEEPYRESLLMRYLEERTPAQISRALGVPVSTVKTRLARGLERLRARLDRRYGGRRDSWLAALLPLTDKPGGAAVTALGAILVSTQVKLALALVVVALGVVYAWPSPPVSEAVEGAVAADSEARAPELEPPSVELASAAQGALIERVVAGAVEARPVAADAADDAAPAATGHLPLQGLVFDAEGARAARVPLLFVRAGAVDGPRGAQSTTRATSRADGSFLFEAIEGPGRVLADGADRVTVYAGHVSRAREEARPVVVVAPRHPLAGRVVDEAGRGLKGVRVATHRPDGFRTRFGEIMDFSAEIENSTRTDADGRFALPDTPFVAATTLRASLAGYSDHMEPMPEFPAAAMLIALRRPAVVEGMLRGQVVDPEGRGVAQARVSYGLAVTTTDEYGSFQFDMDDRESMNHMASTRFGMASPRRLIALKAGYGPARLDTAPSGEPGALEWPESIVLRLGAQPMTIAGRVVDDLGAPVEDIRVWIVDATLFSMDREGPGVVESFLGGSGERWAYTTTGANGEFEVRGLQDRPYRLAAMDMSNLYRVETDPVEAGSSGLRIVMDGGERWQRVAGRVVSRKGEPVGGVTVAPVTDSFRLRYQGQVVSTSHSRSEGVVTGEDGTFVLHDVPKNLVYLRLDGEDIISDDYGRRAEGGIGALHAGEMQDMEVVARLRMHLKIALSDPTEADAVGVLDEEGEVITINVIRGNSRRETPRVDLVEGVSEVLTVHDGARTLVLFKQGSEVRREELELVRGEVNEVRL